MALCVKAGPGDIRMHLRRRKDLSPSAETSGLSTDWPTPRWKRPAKEVVAVSRIVQELLVIELYHARRRGKEPASSVLIKGPYKLPYEIRPGSVSLLRSNTSPCLLPYAYVDSPRKTRIFLMSMALSSGPGLYPLPLMPWSIMTVTLLSTISSHKVRVCCALSADMHGSINLSPL